MFNARGQEYRTKEGGFVLMEGAETGPFMHRRQKRRTIEGWSPGSSQNPENVCLKQWEAGPPCSTGTYGEISPFWNTKKNINTETVLILVQLLRECGFFGYKADAGYFWTNHLQKLQVKMI